MARPKIIRTRLTVACPDCNGTGQWQERAGYACRRCATTGRLGLALRRALSSYTLHLVTAKGTVEKATYYAPATLAADLPRLSCGATVGTGWYEEQVGTTPAGTPVGVGGILFDGEQAGEYLYGYGNGSGATGERTTPNGRVIHTAIHVDDADVAHELALVAV